MSNLSLYYIILPPSFTHNFTGLKVFFFLGWNISKKDVMKENRSKNNKKPDKSVNEIKVK